MAFGSTDSLAVQGDSSKPYEIQDIALGDRDSLGSPWYIEFPRTQCGVVRRIFESMYSIRQIIYSV